MAKGEIKTKLVLEGEAEYKKQMTDAANAIKVLDSEQKLAEAQFKQTGDAQKYAADSAEILRAKMEEQQRAVDAAQAAVNQLTANGVEPNSRAMQTWQTKLNDAKTKLTNLQTKLGETEGDLESQGEAFDDTTADAGEYKDQLDKIEKEVRFQNTIAAIDHMRELLANVLTTAKDLAVQLYNSETEAGKWADSLATAASQAGVDAETYQSWLYASQFIDTEVSAIISNREKLTKKLVSTSDEDAKAFNQLGVVTRNTNGTVRDATDVFWDTVDALGRIEDPTQRAAAAEKIFGNNWKELQPLIENGSDAYKALADEGMRVAVVSQENIDKLGALDDSHNKVNSAMQKTERTLQAQLAPAFTKVNDAAANALTRFNEWAESPEGQEALEKLGDAAVGLVESITEKDFNKVIDLATSAVEKLTGALDWIAQNGEVVVGVIAAMGAAWAGLTVTKEVLEFAHLLQSINWDKIGSSGAGAAAVNGAKSAAESAASSAAGSGLIGPTNPLNFIGRMGLMAGAVYGADKLYEQLPGGRSALKDIGSTMGLYSYTEHSESGQEMYEAIKQAVADGMDASQFTKEKYGSEEIGQKWDEVSPFIERQAAAGKNVTQSLENAYEQLEKVANEAVENLAKTTEDTKTAGTDAAEGYAEGIQESADQAAQAAADMADASAEAVRTALDSHSPSQVMEAIGEDAAVGLANGINARAADAINAATALANEVENALRGALDIHSPSRVMAQLGEYVGEGFAQGIEGQYDAVRRAVTGMMDITTRAPAAPRQARGQAYGTSQPQRIVLTLNGREMAEALAGDMDEQMGMIVRNRR